MILTLLVSEGEEFAFWSQLIWCHIPSAPLISDSSLRPSFVKWAHYQQLPLWVVSRITYGSPVTGLGSLPASLKWVNVRLSLLLQRLLIHSGDKMLKTGANTYEGHNLDQVRFKYSQM